MFGFLVEGLSDAIGFLVGALLGYGLAEAMGLNLFEPGYGTGSIIAILMVGIGGGLGLQMARRLRERNQQPDCHRRARLEYSNHHSDYQYASRLSQIQPNRC